MSHGRITMGGESVQNTSAHSVTIMVRESRQRPLACGASGGARGTGRVEPPS